MLLLPEKVLRLVEFNSTGRHVSMLWALDYPNALKCYRSQKLYSYQAAAPAVLLHKRRANADVLARATALDVLGLS